MVNDRRNLFLKIHERLLELDLSRGRRILLQHVHSPKDAEKLFRDNRREYDLATRALEMLDVAALYVERGYIDKVLFIEEWGVVYSRIQQPALALITERSQRNPDYDHWPEPHFQALAAEVRKLAPAANPQEPQ